MSSNFYFKGFIVVFIILSLCENVQFYYFIFLNSWYRKVVLFISLVPQFSWLNKSCPKIWPLCYAYGYFLDISRNKFQILVTSAFFCKHKQLLVSAALSFLLHFAVNDLGLLWLNLKMFSSCQGLLWYLLPQMPSSASVETKEAFRWGTFPLKQSKLWL